MRRCERAIRDAHEKKSTREPLSHEQLTCSNAQRWMDSNTGWLERAIEDAKCRGASLKTCKINSTGGAWRYVLGHCARSGLYCSILALKKLDAMYADMLQRWLGKRTCLISKIKRPPPKKKKNHLQFLVTIELKQEAVFYPKRPHLTYSGEWNFATKVLGFMQYVLTIWCVCAPACVFEHKGMEIKTFRGWLPSK